MRKPVYCHDPYDIWATSAGVEIRRHYYEGRWVGKLGAIGISVADLLCPSATRWACGAPKRRYPILSALEYLRSRRLGNAGEDQKGALADFEAQAVSGYGGKAWGLGFPWMSKNGLYGPEMPFVTHTPYVMEALLAIAESPSDRVEAMRLFTGTWDFLESLKVMYEEDGVLALSYAPVAEPRIVVNANSYAAFSYAMHAVHGDSRIRMHARDKARTLSTWVIMQQQEGGRWWYYADSDRGNFVDGFHSSFVVKNLLKVRALLPEIGARIDDAIAQGWKFIRTVLFDSSQFLCRRFEHPSHRDPFRWDLYDQAEYLGLLVDFGLFEEARAFSDHVKRRFMRNDHWYCRIDVLGRLWGKDFQRWGIAPFRYHEARLNNLSTARH